LDGRIVHFQNARFFVDDPVGADVAEQQPETFLRSCEALFRTTPFNGGAM